MNSLFLRGFLVLASVCRIHSYSSGAPPSACVSLTPLHGLSPQTSTAPYSMNVSSTTYGPNQQITVSITGSTLRGLIVQARKSSGETIGTFSNPSTDTRIFQCTANSDSWTHSSSGIKASPTVTWTAPSTNMGDIVLK
ncbi:putative defense protein 3 [Patella vulgata]|uniref:putative defense protein 3 n=1 Tax=Patella vulgata TaxID=6465 RepID=UPI0024A9419A|nr:putative defense protein 3 [Patella vulgata]